MGETSHQRKPTFVWQALLILLPVMVLAAFGLVSLRQDKRLAQQEAAERAQTIAAQLVPQIWRALTNAEVPTGSSKPIRFRVDHAGQLLFPPPITPLPTPAPLKEAVLSSEQAHLLEQARTAEAKRNDDASAAKAYEGFLSLAPPEDFAASAAYALGLVLARQQEAGRAAGMFQRVLKDYPKAVGESGLPLGPLAQLKIIQLQTNRSKTERLASMESFYSNVVQQATMLSGYLIEMGSLTETGPGAEALHRKWQGIWEADERARSLYAAACQHFGASVLPFATLEPHGARATSFSSFPRRSGVASATPGTGAAGLAPRLIWFGTTGPENTLLRSQPEAPISLTDPISWVAVRFDDSSTSSWFNCWTDLGVVTRLAGVVDSMNLVPDYFGLSFEVAGKPLVRSAWDVRMWTEEHHGGKGGGWGKAYSGELAKERLASAAISEDGADQLRLNVYLTSPETLYQRQRVRAFWFCSLIAAAAAAGLVGLVTAWSAFHRQWRLSQLKSNFVSSVSHELRAPVASVRLMAESLERGKISEAPKQQEYFRFIVQECRRLSSLVENVLDFSRIEQGRKEYEFEPTDLVRLIEQTVQHMEPYAAERQVSLACAPLGPQLSTLNSQLLLDGKAIQQALVNLIDNAIKHSTKGETVTVGLESVECRASGEEPATAAHPTLDPRPSTLVTLFVEDHGKGIPPSEHEKIFERFYRRGSELRRETQGVGIGLSIVKHIVEAHGGRVRVRSAVGQGSRFTIELPAEKGKEETTDGHG